VSSACLKPPGDAAYILVEKIRVDAEQAGVVVYYDALGLEFDVRVWLPGRKAAVDGALRLADQLFAKP
jgi:hypothetical protein